jgi:hypothetical protein
MRLTGICQWPASRQPNSLEVESVTERRRTDEGQPVQRGTDNRDLAGGRPRAPIHYGVFDRAKPAAYKREVIMIDARDAREETAKSCGSGERAIAETVGIDLLPHSKEKSETLVRFQFLKTISFTLLNKSLFLRILG